ncbi:GDSL-type esterase/lipase family protein [Halalkalibacter krulwichiae]|uniref:Spore germination lipase LipC n=1 Tax=Halalkalibacter krulwichiae TaxID=199441 RepID=A0A1X9M9H1_9BACI|nr:GDSL-type esterase/lipase family protein [Halalkalibacter krulwichiae]ARK30058.1 Spore germination lipase LipC [Halalkalibacter krulwichiae]
MHLSYTALGDSLTVGIGAVHSPGFVKRYAGMIEQAYKVPLTLHIKAKAGLTSTQLLEMLSRANVRKAIAEADLITITIGGNDLIQTYRYSNHFNTLEDSVQRFTNNMQRILAEIASIKTYSYKPKYTVQLIGLYNPIPNVPYSHYFINQYNNVLRRCTNRIVAYVDIYTKFDQGGHYLLSHDFHPNSRGYQIIAEQAFKKLGLRDQLCG